ncbi:peptidylprolyl isomerase [Pelagibacterium montanilacus]|uniref:peptidylprolyl isomerase n=1 Tax=Pelagibacterium montanilacus TaxID=2185280 RepID=UPI000F8CEFA8|nr:SurA N-terminal domain-containing protein [Pelagibacterium montanilacus]
MIRALSFKAAVLALLAGLALTAGPAVAQNITVNGETITGQEINARAQLLRLEGQGSSNANRTQLATDQLIEDALKMAEANRIGVTVADSRVDQAFTNMANNMRVSPSNLSEILTQNGVNPETLRGRIRAGIAWQGVVQEVVTPRVQISELELDVQAEQQVEETMSFDYILKEVLFIIPQGSGQSASRRTAEANQYRSRYSGCDTAVDVAVQFNDAAVRDLGRRHATQLPDALANELASLTVGQISSPRVVDNGVSMMAVCEKASARDLTFIKRDLRQEVGNEALAAEAEAYLARLRDNAIIVRN